MQGILKETEAAHLKCLRSLGLIGVTLRDNAKLKKKLKFHGFLPTDNVVGNLRSSLYTGKYSWQQRVTTVMGFCISEPCGVTCTSVRDFRLPLQRVVQRRLVVAYPCLRTTYRSHLQE